MPEAKKKLPGGGGPGSRSKEGVLTGQPKPYAHPVQTASTDIERGIGALPRPPRNGKEALPSRSAEYAAAACQFIQAPSHGTAADILREALGSSVIFERTNVNGLGEYYRKAPGTCYYEPFPTIRETSRILLEEAVDYGLGILLEKTDGKGIKDLYGSVGKAKSKARTRDFIAGTLSLFSDAVLVFPSIRWNETPETIPTLTDVLDFSGSSLSSRAVREDEYFRNPAPCTSAQVLEASDCPAFMFYMHTLFPNEETMKAGLSCVAACISGKPTKTFQVWTNGEGDGGKNTLYDLIAQLVPGRVIMAKSALILYKGEAGERRFGEIELQGRAAVFFDEVGGCFDISQIKRYTGLSSIRGEAKGRDSVEFSQTWALVALCNELPHFFPANDGGFLSRVFILPFGAVFYADEADKARRISQGVAEIRLKPAADKPALLAELLAERPAILHTLILEWIRSREERSGKPYPAPDCIKAKESYRQSNDLAERFFNDYFVQSDDSILKSELKEAWTEFTGEPRPKMDEIITTLIKRYPFIRQYKIHGTRKIGGVSFKPDCLPASRVTTPPKNSEGFFND